MKKIKGEIIWGIIFAAVVLAVLVAGFKLIDNFSYALVLKMPAVWSVSNLEEKWGEPSEVVIDKDDGGEDYTAMKLYFDGFYILLNGKEYEKQGNDAIATAYFVYGDNFKFTHKKIGIGTGRKTVLNMYEGKKDKIKDLPENELGYIIGKYWVTFYFDDDEKVGKISITYGM